MARAYKNKDGYGCGICYRLYNEEEDAEDCCGITDLYEEF
jgi:hypothetical protein